ncbi:MAG: glycosyltransferase family 39 protein, partial [Chloroflexota bacterium]
MKSEPGQGESIRTAPKHRAILPLILLAYLALGALYALRTPLWQTPDEPAHYNYVLWVAEHGTLPDLRAGDYPAAYLEEIKAARFPPGLSIESIRYESHQPPLYYALAALVARAARPWLGGRLPYLLRLLSVALGALTLLVAHRAVRAAAPRQPGLALAAVALAATLPMHVAMTAAINNDALAELMLNLAALAVLRGADMPATARWSPRRCAGLGLLLGLAFLTKMQSYAAFGAALAALAYDAWRRDLALGEALTPRQGLAGRQVLGRGALMLGVAALVAAPWLVRNGLVYGWDDLLALRRH